MEQIAVQGSVSYFRQLYISRFWQVQNILMSEIQGVIIHFINVYLSNYGPECKVNLKYWKIN